MKKGIIIFSLVAALASADAVYCAQKEIVRQPAFAGSWYPGDKAELQNTVDKLLRAAPRHKLDGDLVALIAPHAGFSFSAPIAAEAFKQIEGSEFKTVILIGPSHGYPLKGISIFDRGYFATPLGKIKINESITSSMISQNVLIRPVREAHRNEHCLEIELPFLQRALKNFDIVPLLTGQLAPADFSKVAETIAKHLAIGKTLLVISSDMSHYPSYTDANRVDRKILDVIRTLDPRRIASTSRSLLQEGIHGLSCTMCGESAVLIASSAARKLKANCVTILKYSNSGDSHPKGWSDKSRVVGYGAVAITRFPSMSPKAQKELLELARKAIENRLEKKGEHPHLKEREISDELSQNLGLFVTLRQGKRLRGCIGQVEYPQPLSQVITQLATSAAFGDPRFPPLTKEELDGITISVTILSPLRKVSDHNEIIPSLHGVLVKRDGKSGLYLPSVWDETGWSKEEFLRHLCRGKARLPETAWKDKETSIYIFTGHSFSEKEL